VENFYGPDAENFDEHKLLARGIQVTKDMVALLRLCEPSRRGNRVNGNIDDQDNLLDQPEDSPAPAEDTMKCPTNICIICCGLSRQSSSNLPPHEFPSKRQDSLRRHLIDTHLVHAREGISCNWEACRNVPQFSKITEFLAHASTAHSYDVNLKLCHLPQLSQTDCNDITSREVSLESENLQRTETPASSVELEMGNIDPRLLEAHPVPITKTSPCYSNTEIATPSGGSAVESPHPISTEVPTRRSTRSTAEVADLASSPEPGSQQGTETPASVDFDMANIDPRLMEPGPITNPSTCLPSTGIPASSGFPLTSTDSNLVEISTRRVTRGAAKAANLEPGPSMGFLPQHSMRSSRKSGRPEEPPGGQQRGKGRAGEMKVSTIKDTPRRSKRLRAQ
jgi:hypothetical protein